MSLSNEPEKLVNTALDTLAQTLKLECCWVQTIVDRHKQQLFLAGHRGFSNAMRAEIVSMDLTHDFTGQIIGMGKKIIIPDLNNDGAYGLDTFRAAGYKWLVAVPLMTYRAYGLLGTASKNRKILEKDTGEFMMVVAGLIANALCKTELTRGFKHPPGRLELTVKTPGKQTPPPAQKPEAAAAPPAVKASLPEVPAPMPPVKPQKKEDTAFHSHTRKMETFRKSHR